MILSEFCTNYGKVARVMDNELNERHLSEQWEVKKMALAFAVHYAQKDSVHRC